VEADVTGSELLVVVRGRNTSSECHAQWFWTSKRCQESFFGQSIGFFIIRRTVLRLRRYCSTSMTSTTDTEVTLAVLKTLRAADFQN